MCHRWILSIKMLRIFLKIQNKTIKIIIKTIQKIIKCKISSLKQIIFHNSKTWNPQKTQKHHKFRLILNPTLKIFKTPINPQPSKPHFPPILSKTCLHKISTVLCAREQNTNPPNHDFPIWQHNFPLLIKDKIHWNSWNRQ
jgi:hypothetical protein